MYSVYRGGCVSHLRLLLNLNTFFSLVLFYLWIHNGRPKRLTNNSMLIKRFFKDEEPLPWIFETFLKNYRFSQKSGNDAYIRGWGSCYWVIMTHCIQKLICDSSLIIKKILHCKQIKQDFSRDNVMWLIKAEWMML